MMKTCFLQKIKINPATPLPRWVGVKTALQAPQMLVLPSGVRFFNPAEIAPNPAGLRRFYAV